MVNARRTTIRGVPPSPEDFKRLQAVMIDMFAERAKERLAQEPPRTVTIGDTITLIASIKFDDEALVEAARRAGVTLQYLGTPPGDDS